MTYECFDCGVRFYFKVVYYGPCWTEGLVKVFKKFCPLCGSDVTKIYDGAKDEEETVDV